MTSSKENKWLWLHTEDNVAVALADFAKDDRILMDGTELVLRQPVDFGHKFALREYSAGPADRQVCGDYWDRLSTNHCRRPCART